MTHEEKKRLFSPKPYALYEDDRLIGTFDSHKAAKAAKHYHIVMANQDMLDLDYTIKPL